MAINTTRIKLLFLLLGLALYFSSFLYLGKAEPSGADITSSSSDDGPVIVPDGRTDLGGRIITMTLDVVQQDSAWKAYVGNITGSLVLRNTNSQSIYEWALGDSALGGNIFVSRNDTVNWSAIRCANDTHILNEEIALGMTNGAADSLNKTFNYSDHSSMVISGVGTIANGTCPSTATYVNGTPQVVDSNAYFQEILLSDNTNIVYATFIDQDAKAFDNNDTVNSTYDFQIIIGENKTATSGHTYYFYADIS